MKHERAERMLAVVLAAVLLAGCGAKPPPPESTAGGRQPAASTVTPGRSHLLESTPPDSMHATTFITEQYTLEKVVQAENGAIVRLNIHLPKLESDSADAARINAELARYYENDVLDYVDCPPAVDPAAWDLSIEMNWEASWYDDCVSLVVSSCYGGTDPIYSQGWCFDFAAGHKLSVTELLMRMGLDPDETQLAVYRAGAAGRRGQPAVCRRYGNRACPADRRVEQPAAGRFHRQLQPWGRGGLVLAGAGFRRQLPAVYPQQPLFLSGRCRLSWRYPGRHRTGILSYPRHRQRPGMGCVQRCIAV